MNNQIRNSIIHEDFLIDPEKELLSFIDEKKEPLALSYLDFASIFYEAIDLKMSFIAAEYELKKSYLEDVQDKRETAIRLAAKHGIELGPDEDVYEIGKILSERMNSK